MWDNSDKHIHIKWLILLLYDSNKDRFCGRETSNVALWRGYLTTRDGTRSSHTQNKLQLALFVLQASLNMHSTFVVLINFCSSNLYTLKYIFTIYVYNNKDDDNKNNNNINNNKHVESNQ